MRWLGPLLLVSLIPASCGSDLTTVALSGPSLGDDARFELPFTIDGIESDDQPAVSHLVESIGVTERAAACVVDQTGDDLPPHAFAALRFATMFTLDRDGLAAAMDTCVLTPTTAAALIADDADERACIADAATAASAAAFLAAVASSAMTNMDNWPNWIPEASSCLDDTPTDDQPDDLPFRSEPANATPNAEPATPTSDSSDETATAAPAKLVIDFGDADITATGEPALPADPFERLAVLTSDTDELTFTPLSPNDSGYEAIEREIAAGHAAVGGDVRRTGSATTSALVWMIAWDPSDPADALFAADWLAWVRTGRVEAPVVIANVLMERLTEPGNAITYLLLETDDTALLVADIGGGDAVVESLIDPLR